MSKSLRLPPLSRHSVGSSTSTSAPTPPLYLFMILASESFSHHSAVQILRSSNSKSARNPRRFNDFDFQIALAPQHGANFDDVFGSRSSASPVYGSCPCEPAKPQTMEKQSIPPARQTPSCPVFARQNISAVIHRRFKTWRQLSV